MNDIREARDEKYLNLNVYLSEIDHHILDIRKIMNIMLCKPNSKNGEITSKYYFLIGVPFSINDILQFNIDIKEEMKRKESILCHAKSKLIELFHSTYYINEDFQDALDCLNKIDGLIFDINKLTNTILCSSNKHLQESDINKIYDGRVQFILKQNISTFNVTKYNQQIVNTINERLEILRTTKENLSNLWNSI